ACQLVHGGNLSISDYGSLFVAVGALVALLAFLTNLRRERSADLLEAATDILEKAYRALIINDDSRIPSNRRLHWLTSARLIAIAEDLGAKISEPSHRRIYREKEDYWRARLYDLIFPNPPYGLPS